MKRVDCVLDKQIDLVLSALMPENALICRIMLATGLRVEDVVSLTRVQIMQGRVTIHEQKTGHIRRVTIPVKLREDILKRSQGSFWAFPSPKDKSKQAVWYDLKRASRAFRLRNLNLECHGGKPMPYIYWANMAIF